MLQKPSLKLGTILVIKAGMQSSSNKISNKHFLKHSSIEAFDILNQAACKKKILIIEDDLDQAIMYQSWLSKHYSVQSVSSSDKIYASLTKDTWDLVLCDIEMPHISGLDVLQYCQNQSLRFPICMLTSHAHIEYSIAAIRKGAVDFLLKPIESQAFLRHVDSILKKSEKKQKSILAIGAHPDDIEIACAGTLLDHIHKGDQVNILTLSQGQQGGNQLIRRQEAIASAEFLNARLFLGKLPDTQIKCDQTSIGVIEKAIKICCADVVYVHSKHDRHQDHRAVAAATMIAARNVAHILSYQSPSSTIEFKPSVFKNIEHVLDQKIQSIQMYRSQSSIRPYMQEQHIRSIANYWGRFANYKAVEAFEVQKQTSIDVATRN